MFSHIIYCSVDKFECIDYNYGDSAWNKMQKSVAFLPRCAGCAIYALNKRANAAAAAPP